MGDKPEVLSTVKVKEFDELYKVVDCLNRTLKSNDLMFGMALDQNNSNQMIFTIYRT